MRQAIRETSEKNFKVKGSDSVDLLDDSFAKEFFYEKGAESARGTFMPRTRIQFPFS